VISLAFLLVGNIEFVQLVQPTLQHGAYWMAIWGRHALLIGLLAHVISTQFASGGDWLRFAKAGPSWRP